MRRIVSADYVPCTRACRAIDTIATTLTIRTVCNHPLPLYEIDHPYGIDVFLELESPTYPILLQSYVAFKVQCQRCRKLYGAFSVRPQGSTQEPAPCDVRAAALALIMSSGFLADSEAGCICRSCAGTEAPPVTAEHPLGFPLTEGVPPPPDPAWFPWSKPE